MRIFLSGQKSFGRAALEMVLKDGLEVAGVSSPRWREQWESSGPDPLARLAVNLGIPWIDSDLMNADRMPLGCDLIVCAHSHAYISAKARNKTRLGAIGYHPSLLPVHRGRDSIEWAIRMRDRITGGTVFWLTDQIDAGPIAAQRHVFIRPGDDASTLWRRDLFPLGLKLLRHTLGELAQGRMVQIPQDHRLATWEPSIGRPPLYRPDLPRLGSIEGMTVIAAAD